MIAEWLRDHIPTLVALDLTKGLAVWRDGGWILGIVGVYFAIAELPDAINALRRTEARRFLVSVTFSCGSLSFALGMAMVDVGWLLIGVLLVVGLVPAIASMRTSSATDPSTEHSVDLPDRPDDRQA